MKPENKKEQHAAICDVEHKARALKAEAERDGLCFYAQHQPSCGVFVENHKSQKCDCGLDALRAEIGKGK
jgi:hypothetical protein